LIVNRFKKIVKKINSIISPAAVELDSIFSNGSGGMGRLSIDYEVYPPTPPTSMWYGSTAQMPQMLAQHQSAQAAAMSRQFQQAAQEAAIFGSGYVNLNYLAGINDISVAGISASTYYGGSIDSGATLALIRKSLNRANYFKPLQKETVYARLP
jgi:hypothetical protein